MRSAVVVLVLAVSAALVRISRTDNERNYILAVLGALLGGLIAFFIASWQFHNEQAAERERGEKLLGTVLKQVALDVRDNKNRLKKLETALNGDRLDKRTWAYANAIIDGLKYSSYELLLSNGMITYLTLAESEALFECYSMMGGVVSLVREAKALAEWSDRGFKTEADEVQLAGDNAATYNRTVIGEFEGTIKRHYSKWITGK